MSDDRIQEAMKAALRDVLTREAIKELLVEYFPSLLIDDIRRFVLHRQADIEQSNEDFGGLKHILQYFMEEPQHEEL